jgi:hypothetical protein
MNPKQCGWKGVPIDESLEHSKKSLVGFEDYVAFILVGPGLLGFILFKDVLLGKIVG